VDLNIKTCSRPPKPQNFREQLETPLFPEEYCMALGNQHSCWLSGLLMIVL
jgi:hypothetical protein